ncbi:MAG: HEPN domain-containing protein [Candidatus Caldarchaeum sp.]|uniref:HEPN domain-containing protein n=1 Tax=Caldiarchaeum subterraneum TaxID=311458 RepID=A0A7C5Q6K7_CALS0
MKNIIAVAATFCLENLRKDEIFTLPRRSEKFRAAADFHMSRGDYDMVVFSLEQSLKLFLKAKLLENGVEFPKTHTLRRLFILLGECLDKRAFSKSLQKNGLLSFLPSRMLTSHRGIFHVNSPRRRPTVT